MTMKAVVPTLPTEALLKTQNHPSNPEEFSRLFLQTLICHQVTSHVEITVVTDHVLVFVEYIFSVLFAAIKCLGHMHMCFAT